MLPVTYRATAASSSTSLLRIDDSSPQLQYSGQWTQAGTSQDYRNTSHASRSPGSTVKFTFNGTYITVYGSIDSNGSNSSYTLDDTSPVSKEVQPVPLPQYNWPFFFPSSPLQPGVHELVIAVDSGTFNLDYIEYIGFPDNDGSLPSPPSSSSPSSSSSSSSSDSAPVASSASSKGKGLPNGAIAGIAVVAAFVVIAVVAALFYVRRRPARKVRHQSRVPEKGIDILVDAPPNEPATAIPGVFRRLSRVYRPTPARSAQSSKTATSSAPTSITQSSAMFTSVIMLSPALSMVSEEGSQQDPSSNSRIAS